MPNVPEAIVAFFAAASIGATWSSCSPDFGPASVIDRFAQIEPKVLFAVNGYRYGGKDFDRRETITHANQERLRELAGRHGDEITFVCSHDPDDLERARTALAAAA